ncbi:hypothetical protein AMS68_006516 [Peltaster fructicola]|uniref:Zn(2)-C6 fungal-type domain-containing protein n=1 Tax=Peltaster fructicola TaxID=286661 RepID=A0A6H0Y2B1_9PEZI|nr:hypothetical protein AMS68_006516 [Peltaster fructicola]
MEVAVATNVDANRKNGKPASCEPCRKAKVRCDHSRPTCGRCRRKRIISRCWYHPAPLTKDRPPSRPLSPVSSAPPQAPSYSTLPTPVPIDASALSRNRQAKAARSIEKLVACLEEAPLIDELVQKYYAISSLFSLVPTSFILPAMTDLRTRLATSRDRKAILLDITHTMLNLAREPVSLDEGTTPSAFIAQHRGESLRVEMLGLIYTIAARASLFDCVQLHENKAAFVQKMYSCSNKALTWARKHLSQVSDTMVWLALENFLLTSQVAGDASLASFRCLGALLTDVLALKLHRESSYSALPFFLIQIRRRVMASTFNLDKFVVALIGSPPKLAKRYIDCELPLDLTESEILAEPPLSQEQLQSLLTPDGWSREARHTGSTHARVRFLLASLREEVLDHEYRVHDVNSVQSLLDLSMRSHTVWESLPAHLRYTADCWSSGIPMVRCLMLITVYLSYRHLDLHIFGLLQKIDSSFGPPMLEVAHDIVDAIVQLSKARSRASFVSYDFAYLIIAHGVPSALQLSAALADRNSARLPSTLSRSTLLRNLSVFVASLESLHDLGDMDKSTATDAVETISRVLDNVLAAPERNNDSLTEETVDDAHEAYATLPAQSARTAFAIDSGVSGFIDETPAWFGDLDWMGPGSDWIKF